MYTSLLGNVSLTAAAWTDVLTLSLDPGVWVLMGNTVAEFQTLGGDVTLRFTDGTVTFGSSENASLQNKTFGGPTNTFIVPLTGFGVADLSLAVAPTTVKMQLYVEEPFGVNAARLARASSWRQGSAGVTWFMAFVDASAKIDQILAAVRKTYPQT